MPFIDAGQRGEAGRKVGKLYWLAGIEDDDYPVTVDLVGQLDHLQPQFLHACRAHTL